MQPLTVLFESKQKSVIKHEQLKKKLKHFSVHNCLRALARMLKIKIFSKNLTILRCG